MMTVCRLTLVSSEAGPLTALKVRTPVIQRRIDDAQVGW